MAQEEISQPVKNSQVAKIRNLQNFASYQNFATLSNFLQALISMHFVLFFLYGL